MPGLLKNICSKFDEHDIEYQLVGDKQEIIVLINSVDGVPNPVKIAIFTDPDDFENNIIQIRIYNLLKVQYITSSLLKTINELNASYRWYRVYLDDENDIVLDIDAIVDIDDPGEEVFALLIHGISLCELYYPKLKKVALA